MNKTNGEKFTVTILESGLLNKDLLKKIYLKIEYFLCLIFLLLLLIISWLYDDVAHENYFTSNNFSEEILEEVNERKAEKVNDFLTSCEASEASKDNLVKEKDGSSFTQDSKIEANASIEVIKPNTSLLSPETNSPQDIWETNEDLGLKGLFHEKVPINEFFEFDMMYNEIQNLEAFINNGAIEIDVIKNSDYCVKPSFIHFITNKINVPLSEIRNADAEEQERYMRSVIADYRMDLEINREEWGKLDERYNNVSLDTPSPTSIYTENSIYEKLVKAMISGKSVTVYEENSHGKIDSLKEWPESSSSKGDWSKLEPLTGFTSLVSHEEVPKQIIFISDKKANGESIVPLPNIGNIGIRPSDDDPALTIWEKDMAIMKAWAKKYPFFPEHYVQMQNASQAVNNEAWWLAQQDNSLKWDRPTEESNESYYLEELFGEKEYLKSEYSVESKDRNNRSNNTLFSAKPDNRFDNSNNIIGRRHISTSTRANSSISNSKVNSKIVNEFLKEKNLNPVYVYENLGENSTKKIILQETKGLSGVYLILNKVTKDYYIGSASTNRFHARFSNHLINLTGSKIVKLAVRKYKLTEFAFIILELFTEVVTKENNKKLLDLEDFYLKSLLPNYNILTEAGSSFGYKHTEMARIKMKDNYSDECRLKIGSLNKNKNLSKETIEKLREAALLRKPITFSEEAIANMKKKSKPIIVYNLDDTVYGEYPSIVEAASSLNCNQKTIIRALKSNKNLLKRRWIVKYALASYPTK